VSSDDQVVADASYSFPRRVLIRICEYDFFLYLAFVLEVILLLFALLSFLFANLDAETWTILMIDFALLGVTLGTTIGLINLCGRLRR